MMDSHRRNLLIGTLVALVILLILVLTMGEGGGCSGDSDCSGSTPFCDTGTKECRACKAADCSGAAPFCDAGTGACRACTLADCAGTNTPFCSATTGACRKCEAGDCGGNAPVCTAQGTCAACAGPQDCSAPTPYCVTAAGDPQRGSCQACAYFGEGYCGKGSPYCDAETGACRPCIADGSAGDCDPDTQYCDSASGGCVPLKGCEPTCYDCGSDADCADHTGSGLGTCDASGEYCRHCVPADCKDPASPVCDSSAGVCRACVDGDCRGTGAPVCDAGGSCRGCEKRSECTFDPTAPVCDGGACRGCASNADCTEPGAPICHGGGSCGVCESSGECAGLYPGLEATCQSGSCVVCHDGTCREPEVYPYVRPLNDSWSPPQLPGIAAGLGGAVATQAQLEAAAAAGASWTTYDETLGATGAPLSAYADSGDSCYTRYQLLDHAPCGYAGSTTETGLVQPDPSCAADDAILGYPIAIYGPKPPNDIHNSPAPAGQNANFVFYKPFYNSCDYMEDCDGYDYPCPHTRPLGDGVGSPVYYQADMPN